MSQGSLFRSAEKASLDLGTCGTPLWLLRSRPDQIHGAPVRGGPPSSMIRAVRHRNSC